MRKHMALTLTLILTLVLNLSPFTFAQQGAIKTVEITPGNIDVEVGQKLKFTAVGKDAQGKVVDQKVLAWFTGPFDLAGADETGTITFFEPGAVKIGAVVGGQTGYVMVNVKPAPVTRIAIDSPDTPIFAGSTTMLQATAQTKNGDPRTEVQITWSSSNPAVARVDAAGVVTGVKTGKARIQANADAGTGSIDVEVVANPVRALVLEPKSTSVKTGDVVRFSARARDAKGSNLKTAAVRWAVSGTGASVYPDGGFVADTPGTYIVTAACGDRIDTASVVVTPRHAERELEL